MRKRLAALWQVLVAIRSGVLVTQMRHGLPLAAAFVLAGCGFMLSPEALVLSLETPANPSATSVSDVLLAPGHKLVLPPPATYGSRIKVRQLVTIEFAAMP